MPHLPGLGWLIYLELFNRDGRGMSEGGKRSEWHSALMLALAFSLPAAYFPDLLHETIRAAHEHRLFQSSLFSSLGHEFAHPTVWPELVIFTGLLLLEDVSRFIQVYVLRTLKPSDAPRMTIPFMIVEFLIFMLLLSSPVHPVAARPELLGWSYWIGAMITLPFAVMSFIAMILGAVLRFTGASQEFSSE